MNDPLGRIEALERENAELKSHQKETDDRLKAVEQATEPIELKIVRGLPLPEATLLQKIMDQVGKMTPDVAKLTGHAETVDKRLDRIEQAVQEILRRLPEEGE